MGEEKERVEEMNREREDGKTKQRNETREERRVKRL